MKIKKGIYCKKIINGAEIFFALVVMFGVILFFIQSVITFAGLDWSSIDTFYDFISRILVLAVGLELVRLLITQDIYATSYLLMFVVARKVLRPESSSMDILLAIIAFTILFIINIKFRDKKTKKHNL